MDAYKTLLVHYDAGRAAPRRLELALELARPSDAHVACLYALDRQPEPSAGVEARQIVQEAMRQARAMLAEAQRGFEEVRRRSGANIEWRTSGADAIAAVALHARYADLVVIGQQNEDLPSGVGPTLERDLPLSAGRPVLVVPYAFEGRPVGRRILVAWNASREAARAVSDAMPLLRRADEVHVVTVNARASSQGHGEEPGADAALYLARHGVKVTVARQEAAGVDIGNFLLSRAFDLQSDLIVCGAWGHSRLRELVLGGVTRTLLASMTVPVLLSH
jgi:nucleotide-binding universal stress UspA family protein